jgi:hypothetical protein
MMKTVIPTIAIGLALSISGCTTGNDDTSGYEAKNVSTASDRTSGGATDVELTGGIRFDEGVEFCMDWFPNRKCTSSFPSPQCRGAVAGEPCPSVGLDCYVTIDSRWFRRFSCI